MYLSCGDIETIMNLENAGTKQTEKIAIECECFYKCVVLGRSLYIQTELQIGPYTASGGWQDE